MGKQSSAKKVARAARAGSGGGKGRNRKFGFPAAVVGVFVIGVALVVFARVQLSGADTPPQIGEDHWHSAIAVWTCDQFLATPLADTQGDKNGIHTHEDGLMHIHPTSSIAAGENAKLGVFTDEVGIELGGDSFTLPTGETYTTGDDCQGEKGEVVVLKWPAGGLDGDPEIIREDFGDIRFEANGEAYTIAFIKPDQDLKALLPPSTATLNAPNDLAPGETVQPVEVPEGLSTTLPAEGGGTTVAPGATTVPPADGTVAPADTTPAAATETTAAP
jgi:hypothetical protein